MESCKTWLKKNKKIEMTSNPQIYLNLHILVLAVILSLMPFFQKKFSSISEQGAQVNL